MINFLIFRLLLLLSHLQIFLYHHQTHLHTNIFHHLNLLYHQESSDSSWHYLTLLNLQALHQSKTNPYHYLQHSLILHFHFYIHFLTFLIPLLHQLFIRLLHFIILLILFHIIHIELILFFHCLLAFQISPTFYYLFFRYVIKFIAIFV